MSTQNTLSKPNPSRKLSSIEFQRYVNSIDTLEKLIDSKEYLAHYIKSKFRIKEYVDRFLEELKPMLEYHGPVLDIGYIKIWILTYILATHLESHPIPAHPIPSHPKSQIPFPSQSQIPSQIPFKSILASSGRRRTKIPPFEPARRDELNGGIPILLRPLDVKIFNETSKYQSTKNGFVNISLNNLAPSGHREMNLLPFDSSC